MSRACPDPASACRRPPRTDLQASRSLQDFVLLEFALSVPFWGIGALARAHVIPDRVMFRAAWSLTPMMAASILVHRESGTAGVHASFRRIVDYRRIRSKLWFLPALLAGPFIALLQYGLARWSGAHIPTWVRGRTRPDGLRA
jgi:hypothetical protein